VAYEWFKNSRTDMLQFMLDLTLYPDLNAIMFKIAGFTKR